MIGVVDYGSGNLMSVRFALQNVGAEVRNCQAPGDFADVDRVVLPGVGAFAACMKHLRESGLLPALTKVVFEDKKPFLGICLGMQVLAGRGEEGGPEQGLGWIAGEVTRLKPTDGSRVPHVGWNEVKFRPESPLFEGVPANSEFYFTHSYAFRCQDEAAIDATSDHGGTFVAAVRWRNVFATQFHPEKSQKSGLRVLSNFVRWRP